MIRTIGLPALLLLLVLALAACDVAADDAGPDASDAITGEGGGEATDSNAPGDTRESADEVRIEALSYSPKELTVSVGDTVTWVNDDPLRHTVTAGHPDIPDPDRFDIEMAGEGDTAEVAFDEAGEFAYFCDVHKPMRATIIVTE